MIKNIIDKWKYFGKGREVLEYYSDALERNNIKVLREAVVVGAMIFAIATYLYTFVDRHIIKAFVCMTGIVLMGIIFFIANKIYINEYKISTKTMNIVVGISSTIVYMQAVYLGTFGSSDKYAVTCIWLIVFLLIGFDTVPTRKLINIVYTIVFIVCSYLSKDIKLVLYDVSHIVMALFIGFYMSWHKTKLTLERLIVKDELDKKNQELEYLNTKDHLTGLYNRQSIFDYLLNTKRECKVKNKHLMCLVMDLDDFKLYNDYYGHPEGDNLLKEVGRVLNDIATKRGIRIGRIGGEEFLAVWEADEIRNASKIAEEIRNAIIDLNVTHVKSTTSTVVTISQGLFISDRITNKDIDKAYRLADSALYTSKRKTKNCCHLIMYNYDQLEISRV